MAGFFLALQFLTVLPARAKRLADDAPHMEQALPWFPLVGALLGGVLAGGDWALSGLFTRDTRDIFLVAAMALLTGMLHMDGFIDCCDGLLGTRSVERRLEILRDSRVGAYGAIGAAILVL
ncbi:MAG TPA: adenosylcobinamide-GDP ribazoletransferase, partial [Ktedonobacterales bacterium]|nr:adenosylcobinamide-GDP ribazoletransferase [Ktedonobacterales bacterium]